MILDKNPSNVKAIYKNFCEPMKQLKFQHEFDNLSKQLDQLSERVGCLQLGIFKSLFKIN